MKRASIAFVRFWWEFLIGDTPELFCGVLLLAGMTWLLRHEPVAASIALPVGLVGLIAASVLIRSRD